MTTGRHSNFWTLIIIFLVAVTIAGGIITGARCSRSQPIEISIAPARELQGDIYIGGAVNNPGLYPLKAGDNLESILRAAGGATDSAGLNRLKLYVGEVRAEAPPQKVNINRAEAWLLEALPGIRDVRAQAIIDYRRQNGRFNNINELMKVDGIGAATFAGVEHLITIAD